MNFLPGQLVVIEPGALGRIVGSTMSLSIERLCLGVIIQKYLTYEKDDCYAIFICGQQRICYVSHDYIRHSDHASDPSRLFGVFTA